MLTSLRHMQFHPSEQASPGRRRILIEAGDRCDCCARPHNRHVRILPDGRWFDAESGTWRDGRGVQASWPDIVDYSNVQHMMVVLAVSLRQSTGDDGTAAHHLLLCQRCRPVHRREEHRRHSRITAFRSRALGDLFQGTYQT